MTMIMAVNISAWCLLLVLLMVMSSNQQRYSATAIGSPQYPYPFMFTNIQKIDQTKFDYIIVGGGTAGCPLAATLSANYSVLLLERGDSPYGIPEIENADAFGKLLGETDNYTSPAQAFVSEDGVSLARARVLGGGTALNGGFYTRASVDYVRKMQWDEQLVKESYEWVEKQNVFRPDHLSPWSSAFKDALLEVGVLPYNGYTLDHMDGTKISAATFDNKGKRHTAADLLKTANPNNIKVILKATVSKIIFYPQTSQGSSGKPRASGVEFNIRGFNDSFQVYLNEPSPPSEIILSAGALGSPQLLLLSGIGPSKQLRKFNISPVLHSPSVGKGVQDNPRATATLQSPTPLGISSIQAVGIVNNSQTYIYSGSVIQPANGSASPQAKNVSAGRIFEKLAYPLSRGQLWLRTTDPRDNPAVRYNYYKHPQDLKKCVHGVRLMAKIFETQSLQRFTYAAANNSSHEFHFIGPALPKSTSDDAAMVQFCHDTLNTMWHFHGGCNVGSVVNHQYKVNGVENVRVVDGSTFTDAPGTNTQATTLMLGRYVGMKILQERKK
eukprot:PITA_05197